MVKRLENNFDEMYDLSITNFRKGLYTARNKIKKIAKPVKRGALPAFLAGVVTLASCKFPGPDPNPTPTPTPPDPTPTAYVTISGKCDTSEATGGQPIIRVYSTNTSNVSVPIESVTSNNSIIHDSVYGDGDQTDATGNFSLTVDKSKINSIIYLQAGIINPSDKNKSLETYVRTLDLPVKDNINISTDPRANPAIEPIANPDFPSREDYKQHVKSTNGSKLKRFDLDNFQGIEIMLYKYLDPSGGSFDITTQNHIKEKILAHDINDKCTDVGGWFGGTSDGSTLYINGRPIKIIIDDDSSTYPNGAHLYQNNKNWIVVEPYDVGHAPQGNTSIYGQTSNNSSSGTDLFDGAGIELLSGSNGQNITNPLDYVISHEFGHASVVSYSEASGGYVVFPLTVMQSEIPDPDGYKSGVTVGKVDLKEARDINKKTHLVGEDIDNRMRLNWGFSSP